MRAKDVMSICPITVDPDNSVSHAARIMRDHNISGLPVVDAEGALVGILTEGDLLRRAEIADRFAEIARKGWKYGDPRTFVRIHSWRVADVMSAPVISVTETTGLGDIATLFLDNDIKRVPVMRGRHLVGVVSRADLLKCIETAVPEPVAGGDDALRLAIETRLAELASLKQVPQVKVSDGVVYLEGTLPSQDDRAAVRVLIEGVGGIEGIVDHLRIMPNA